MNELGIREAMCRIVSWGQVAIDPSIMGVAPLYAIKKAVCRIKLSIKLLLFYYLEFLKKIINPDYL